MALPMAPRSNHPGGAYSKAKLALELFTLTSTLIAFGLTADFVLRYPDTLSDREWPWVLIWPIALPFLCVSIAGYLFKLVHLFLAPKLHTSPLVDAVLCLLVTVGLAIPGGYYAWVSDYCSGRHPNIQCGPQGSLLAQANAAFILTTCVGYLGLCVMACLDVWRLRSEKLRKDMEVRKLGDDE